LTQRYFEFCDTNDNNNLEYTCVELFAGAGGLALGLEQAGFKTQAVVEIDKTACATLKKNRPNWNIINHDIQDITKIGIKKFLNCNINIDLLSGGYPCQSFSYAGNRLGIEDTRGTLFFNYAEILQELKPKVFLAENVKGLVSHDKGKTLQTMIKVFENSGYKVYYKVLSALHYGVAQKRERIFIIGIREDIRAKIDKDFEFPKPYNYTLTLKDILNDVPESECAKYNQKKIDVLKHVKPGGCWRDLPDDIAKEYMKSTYYMSGGRTGIARRLSWDEPGLTVLCTPAQKQTERCHPEEIRPFSIRENARIQSFPDSWKFEGSISAKYKQIGNAVPVNLAKEVGLAIKQYLHNLKDIDEL
jgi:DNA (cytosine-5)-methyltransferase 1